MARESAAKVVLSMSMVLALGCGAEETATETTPVLASELSRALNPPIEIAHDPTIGASIDDVVAEVSAGADTSYSPTLDTCVMTHFEREGLVIAVHEHCIGSHSRLFAYRFEPGDGANEPSVELERVYGDLGDDGIIDAWFDPAIDLMLEDVNLDDSPDARTESAVDADVSLEGFDPTFVPPAYLGERILEDTDFDGLYDLETITAGLDPEGNQTYWQQ
jgi:hypothetical protein